MNVGSQLHGRDFKPPWLLRNGHFQTMFAASALRRRLLPTSAFEVARRAEPILLDGGDRVRLSGGYTAQQVLPRPRGLAVLFHGWEGHIDASYLLQCGSRLLREGWDVCRLNFRDHGDSLGLNPELFHSCRIDEVIHALAEMVRRWPARPLAVAGFSLGGNFALRVALRAPAASLPLAYALAVCPLINARQGLYALESPALWVYRQHFLRQWRRTLRAKQRLFPQYDYFAPQELEQGLRELTATLVRRHTDYPSLDAYLEGYSLDGEALARLAVPTTLLAVADDPVIPLEGFLDLPLPACAELDIAPYGGHCGFLAGLRTSFVEAYFADRFRAVGLETGG